MIKAIVIIYRGIKKMLYEYVSAVFQTIDLEENANLAKCGREL